MNDASVLRWGELPIDEPMALVKRRRVIGEKVMISRVELANGFFVPTHQHDNEQIVVMLEGRCLFGLGAEGTPAWREVEVKAGEVVMLPSRVPHSCRALVRSVVLDVFSPPSAKTGIDRA